MASSSGGYAADGASEHTAGTHEDASEHEKKRVPATTDKAARVLVERLRRNRSLPQR